MDGLLESWRFTLEALGNKPESLIGGVDWITKKWLLETFMAAENVGWDDEWLESLDLAYHNVDRTQGLFFGVHPGKRIGEWNQSVRRTHAMTRPPSNTRALGRARAVEWFQREELPYVINWDSIATDSRDFLVMGDPFRTYEAEVTDFLVHAAKRPAAKPRQETLDRGDYSNRSSDGNP
jgi:proteasome accessory factor A